MANKTLPFIIVAAIAFMAISTIFYIGVFVSSFGNNICFSEVIQEITEKVESATKDNSAEKNNKLNKMLSEIPRHGYETNCEEIKKYLVSFKEGV